MSDNGPEFIEVALNAWLKEQGARPTFITPGSPWENGLHPLPERLTDVDALQGISAKASTESSGPERTLQPENAGNTGRMVAELLQPGTSPQ